MKTLHFRGWTLELDEEAAVAQLKSDDPGQFAPVMVESPNGSRCTENAALNIGECEYETIPDGVYKWIDNKVADFWEKLV